MVNSIFERALESTFLHYTYIIECISLCFMILYVHCINNSPANVPTTLKVREFEFEKRKVFKEILEVLGTSTFFIVLLKIRKRVS